MIQFRKMQLWYSTPNELNISIVQSYESIIGFIDWDIGLFYEWAYGEISRTTSKQITVLERHYKLTRYHLTNKHFYDMGYTK